MSSDMCVGNSNGRLQSVWNTVTEQKINPEISWYDAPVPTQTLIKIFLETSSFFQRR